MSKNLKIFTMTGQWRNRILTLRSRRFYELNTMSSVHSIQVISEGSDIVCVGCSQSILDGDMTVSKSSGRPSTGSSTPKRRYYHYPCAVRVAVV